MSKILESIRKSLRQQGLHGILIPHNDTYFGEYLVEHDERIAWITEFTGSAGFLIITEETAVLFVDGRYTLQAKQQVDQTHFTLDTLGEEKNWVKVHGKKGQIFGYDPTCFSESLLKSFQDTLVQLQPLHHFLEALWDNRPTHPIQPLVLHNIKFSGKEAFEKINHVRKTMYERDVECTLLPPESWSWMLNVRGADLTYTPVSQGFCLITESSIDLFLHTPDQTKDVIHTLENLKVQLHHIEDMDSVILSHTHRVFGYDPHTTPLSIKNQFETCVPLTDPCALPRAIKNKVEIEGAIQAHIKDAVAWINFWNALNQKFQNNIPVTEMDIDAMLLDARREQDDFVCPSFATIAGFGPHGAIVHYRADEKSNRTIQRDELLLIDSGGQYRDGTTDITRTLVVGTPSKEMMRDFTLVLKGHIAIATAQFPAGTNGGQLDILARLPLWKNHKDFAHGTGHGVGSFLSVHEGPQRISKLGHHPLYPGMILSNEPGYYENGKYGIRIESLVYVKEVREGWLGFETLTLVPLDRRLIDLDLLNTEEKQWIIDYRARIRKVLNPHLKTESKMWLDHIASPL